jgi:23S rRNA pseudouridine1911/1915/1917 synthase
MSVRSRSPRAAVSHVTVLERLVDLTLVGVRPETGRTHQIRVHLASIGHPCVGDALYGRREADGVLQRQALHALMLEIDHPRTGLRHSFRAPVADDLRAYLATRGVDSSEEAMAAWLMAEEPTGREQGARVVR